MCNCLLVNDCGRSLILTPQLMEKFGQWTSRLWVGLYRMCRMLVNMMKTVVDVCMITVRRFSVNATL